MRRCIVAVAILTILAPAAEAQTPTKGRPGAATRKALHGDALLEAIRTELEARAEGNEGTESALNAKQLTAPSAAKAGGSVADAPSFVQVIGLAVENDLIGVADGAYTLDLNLFAFKTLVDPAVLVRDESYARYSALRRLGGSVTVGGKGEAFDRDRDGKKDDAKKAEAITDIVTAEVRWRIFGTRDRRDARSQRAYVEATAASHDALLKNFQNLSSALLRVLVRHDAAAAERNQRPLLEPCGEGRTCVFQDRLDEVIALMDPAFEAQFKELSDWLKVHAQAHADAVKAINRSPIVTAVFMMTRQGEDFGPERIGGAVRGVFATGAWDHTLNAEWKRADWRNELPRGTSTKLAYGLTRLLSADPDAAQAPKLTLAFNAERFRNVPGAKHDAILTAGARVDIPINESMSIPVSMTYASHADLLTDQKLVAGHVGVAWDFSGLSKKKK